MNQKINNEGFHPAVRLLLGLAILVGGLFVVDAMLGINLGTTFWPLRIIVPGLALFILTLSLDEKLGVALSIVSAITTMTGLILLLHLMTGYWATWAYSWALIYPTAVGLGMLAYGVVKTKPKVSRTGWNITKIGLALLLVFAVFFEFILGLGGFELAFGWPLLIISLGIFVLTLSGFDFKQHDSLLSNATGTDQVSIKKKIQA